MKCPNCGVENTKEVKFCGQCGGRMDQGVAGIQCSICGFVNLPETKFCGGCGNVLALIMTEDRPSGISISASPHSPRIRTGYIIGGGLVAAIFFGLFYWATTYTWTERIWHEALWGFGYWEEVTHTLDPAIQASFLVVAIIGLIAMVYGVISQSGSGKKSDRPSGRPDADDAYVGYEPILVESHGPRREKVSRHCRHCGLTIPENSMFCEYCGQELGPNIKHHHRRSGPLAHVWGVVITLFGLISFVFAVGGRSESGIVIGIILLISGIGLLAYGSQADRKSKNQDTEERRG